MAPHASILAWKIPWTEEPGGLQSMGSLRVGHDWATSLSLLLIGEGNGNPLQCSCLENPRDGGAWWAAVYGVAQSRTWLKRLSSTSSSLDISLIVCLLDYFLEKKKNKFSSNGKSFDHFLFTSMKEEGAPSLVTTTHVDFFSSMENKISLKLPFV